MAEFELSAHARDMLRERNIQEQWVWRTVNSPDSKEKNFDDGNVHYTKAIRERDGQVLHVVVNRDVQPNRIVTLFFVRRLRRRK